MGRVTPQQQGERDAYDRVMRRCWLAVVLVLVAGVARVAHAGGRETPEDQVLRLVNQHRKTAGLAPVTLDRKLSKGCMEHAEYMRLNRGTSAMEGLAAHKQRPDLPGATPAGAACGKAADLYPEVSDFAAAVEGWMAGFYHRRPILDPGLGSIAVGYAPLPGGSYMAALMFPEHKPAEAGWPVAYPADGQTGVALEYGREIPNPIPAGKAGGYPVTLQFPPFDAVTGVRAELRDGKGGVVPVYLSDPEHPATSFGQYGVVSLIAKQPLRPETRYRVVVDASWKGQKKRWSWSFTTLALRQVDADDEAALLAALEVPSKVRGVVVYGGMMDTETVFLSLAQGPRREMVSVLIPIAVWQLLARRAKPASFKGKSVEVTATPRLAQGKYINLPIATPAQLRVMP